MQEEALSDLNWVIERYGKTGIGNNKIQYCYYRRGFALKALKRYGEAASDFEKAKQIDPMNPFLNVNYKQLKGVNYVPIRVPGELDF